MLRRSHQCRRGTFRLLLAPAVQLDLPAFFSVGVVAAARSCLLRMPLRLLLSLRWRWQLPTLLRQCECSTQRPLALPQRRLDPRSPPAFFSLLKVPRARQTYSEFAYFTCFAQLEK